MDRSPKDAKRPDGGFGVDGGPRSGRWGRPPALGGLPLTVGSELGLADGPGPNTIVRNKGVRFGGGAQQASCGALARPAPTQIKRGVVQAGAAAAVDLSTLGAPSTVLYTGVGQLM